MTNIFFFVALAAERSGSQLALGKLCMNNEITQSLTALKSSSIAVGSNQKIVKVNVTYQKISKLEI